MKFSEYHDHQQNEGMLRFLKKIWDDQYWDLPNELKAIYNSLDEFQHQQIARLLQYNKGMSLAQALGSLTNIDPKLQWKAYGKKGGQFKPATFDNADTFKRQGETGAQQQNDPNNDWWKKYGY